jgi:hypothetical protein
VSPEGGIRLGVDWSVNDALIGELSSRLPPSTSANPPGWGRIVPRTATLRAGLPDRTPCLPDPICPARTLRGDCASFHSQLQYSASAQ